jgi:hypothetical protein
MTDPTAMPALAPLESVLGEYVGDRVDVIAEADDVVVDVVYRVSWLAWYMIVIGCAHIWIFPDTVELVV